MSEEMNTQNTEQQPTTQPADNGNQSGGKMFTQDDVNRIVSERLARDRQERSAQKEADARERSLQERENRMSCKEYLHENNYPAELLDVIDCSDVEKFKETVGKVNGLYEAAHNRPYFVSVKASNAPRFCDSNDGNRYSGGGSIDPIREAFMHK